MKISDSPVELTFDYGVTVDRLWTALTDPGQMQQWFFANMPDFRAEEGFSTSFPVVANGRLFTHEWEIKKVEQERLLSYSWSYKEYEGMARVAFGLKPNGASACRLDFRMTIEKDFESGIPELELNSCLQGWNYFLGNALSAFLEGSDNAAP